MSILSNALSLYTSLTSNTNIHNISATSGGRNFSRPLPLWGRVCHSPFGQEWPRDKIINFSSTVKAKPIIRSLWFLNG